jgi:hypothetical protein
MLSALFAAGTEAHRFSVMDASRCRRKGKVLTYRVLSAEQGKSASPPFGEVKPQGGSTAMRIAELGKSEGCSVMGQIDCDL